MNTNTDSSVCRPKPLGWIRLLELTKVTSLNRISPQLEHSECYKTNGLNLYTRRDSIIMGRVWWLMKMGIREFNARVAVIPIVEVVTLCVVVSVVPLGRPGNVESTGLGLDTIVEMEMNYFWIK